LATLGFTEDHPVLHPSQFPVNETWIAFKLNDAPIETGADGDFNLIALMDAASCFILSSGLVPSGQAGPSNIEVKRLLKQASAHKKKLPKTLYIPVELAAANLEAEAEKQKISVVSIAEDQLLVFIGEARDGFKERLGGGSVQ
jgi:hypothetical protein